MKPWVPGVAQILKGFYYGDPGSGKTTFLATAQDEPRTSPVFWIDCGGNPESIRNRAHLPPVMVTLEKTKDLNDIYDWFAGGQKPEHRLVKTLVDVGLTLPSERFKTIVFDGYTEFQRLRMDEVLGNVGKKAVDDLNKAQIQHWGEVLSTMTYVSRLFFGLSDVGVLISALERQEQDQLSGTFSYSPALWGQSRSAVPTYSLMIGRVVRRSKMGSQEKKDVGDDTYSVVYFDQVGRFLAKDQYGSLPKYLANPTITAVMDAVYGKTA